MIEICKKQDCVGCGACLSACNKAAISMQPDSLGFLYPVINQDKCVDCGLCAKSCFNNYKLIYNEPIATYVGHALKREEQISSTSGGIASVFMRVILSSGGVVYGCSGENARDIKHTRIETPDEIEKLKGSKYVQSYLGQTYMNVIADLKINKTVLFIGTPCQIAGLKTYLKGKTYEKLYTVDFVCHGVPSQQILNDAINSKIRDCNNLHLINRVKDRRKKSKYTMRLLKDNHIVCDETYPSMGYITGFLCGLYYRENCYQCKFAQKGRISDITLGDFWDRYDDIKNLANKKDGLSMIIVNTNQGNNLMKKCNIFMEVTSWEYEDFVIRNGQLKQPIKRHAKREQFEKLYIEKGYQIALKETLKNDLKNIRKNLFLNALSSFMYHVPLVNRLYMKFKNS